MKHILSLPIALLCVALIELCLGITASHLPKGINSQLLHMAYYKPVRHERVMVAAKYAAMVGDDAEIVQVGDSSGMVSVKPSVIRDYLPANWNYLNASLQVPAQFKGFESLATRILDKDKKKKYLLCFFSLFHLGSQDEGFGEEITSYYNSIWRPLFTLPSLGYRNFITNAVYYPKIPEGELDFVPELRTFSEWFMQEKGWFGINIIQPAPEHDCAIAHFNDALALSRLQAFYTLAKKQNVELMLVTGPLRCNYDETIKHIENVFMDFQHTHPSILLPLPIYTKIDPRYMGDDTHTTIEGAPYYSKMLGEALQKTIAGGTRSLPRPF